MKQNCRMIPMKERLLLRPQLSGVPALILHHTVFILLLTCAGESSQPIVAMMGDDIVLPCQVERAVDASGLTVEWSRPDLDPRFVHLRRDSVELVLEKNPLYKGRTSLSTNRLKRGDISMKLSKVKVSDEGTYKGFVPTSGTPTDCVVQLTVGSVSFPDIKISKVSNGVLLVCKSKGWYPEPEVLWLDGEGNLLSAGPTETVRGPDDLYTVSSRVTVEKRHSNSFTCRVQQNHINQTRETLIHVPDDFFKEPSGSGSTVAAVIFALVGVTSVLAACFVFWKRKQKKNNSQTYHVKEETTRGSEASEQEHLIDTAEGEPLKNQSEVNEGMNTKYEQTRRSDQIEEEQSERFRMEAEGNVGTGSQYVMENERQQHEVQKTEDVDNREKETKPVSEGSSDQAETETLREKPVKGEETGDRVEGTKSETEDQGLMEGEQQQPVMVGGEAKNDPHKEENKEQTQTESAGQSPTDGGTHRDQPSAGDGTHPGMEEKKEETKSVSEGSSDQEETETLREKPEKAEVTGDREEGTKSETEDQSLIEGEQQQPVATVVEANTDHHKVSEDTKSEDGGGGGNSTPQSPGDEQPGQLKDTDGHNTVNQSDKNKEAEKSTDNATVGQRQTAAQTQHGDKTDEERQSDHDTDSVSDKTETPSLINPKTTKESQTVRESEKSPGSIHGEEERKPDKNTGSAGNGAETSSQTVSPETKTGQQTGEESEKIPESRDGDNNQTTGDNATTPDQNSAKDGKRGEEKKEVDNSQRVNDHNNRGDDTCALSNNPGSQTGSDRGQEQVDEDRESDDGTSD